MLLLRLAWRNLWRHPRRTALSLFGIAFASAVLIFFVSLQFSSYKLSIGATLKIFTGHLQLRPSGTLEMHEIQEVIPDAEILRDKLAHKSEIMAAGVRASTFALLSSATRTLGAQIVGVEPDKERIISSLPGVLRKGQYLFRPDAPEIVLTSTLAKNLNAEVGSEVTLIGQAADGSLAAGALKVIGVIESGNPEIDRALAQLPLHTFQSTFGLSNGAHSIVFSLKEISDVQAVKQELNTTLKVLQKAGSPKGSYQFYDWNELIPGLKQAITLDMASAWILYITLIIIVSFGVLNTFFMSILERRREFGIMLCLGMLPNRIFRVLFLECLILIIVGVLCGELLGAAVTLYFGVVGFKIPGAEEMMKHWNLPSAVHTELGLISATLGPGIVLGISLLAALIPVLRIFSLSPIQAIKVE